VSPFNYEAATACLVKCEKPGPEGENDGFLLFGTRALWFTKLSTACLKTLALKQMVMEGDRTPSGIMWLQICVTILFKGLTHGLWAW